MASVDTTAQSVATFNACILVPRFIFNRCINSSPSIHWDLSSSYVPGTIRQCVIRPSSCCGVRSKVLAESICCTGVRRKVPVQGSCATGAPALRMWVVSVRFSLLSDSAIEPPSPPPSSDGPLQGAPFWMARGTTSKGTPLHQSLSETTRDWVDRRSKNQKIASTVALKSPAPTVNLPKEVTATKAKSPKCVLSSPNTL